MHPRDDAQNRALIARAERLFGERAAIGYALSHFITVLDRQNPDEIVAARRSLSDLVEQMDESFLL